MDSGCKTYLTSPMGCPYGGSENPEFLYPHVVFLSCLYFGRGWSDRPLPKELRKGSWGEKLEIQPTVNAEQRLGKRTLMMSQHWESSKHKANERKESGELWVLWTEERAKFTCLANLNLLLVLLLKFRLSGEGEGEMDQPLKAFSTLAEELPSSVPSNYMAVYQLSVFHSIRSNVILCSPYMSVKHLLYTQARILIQEKKKPWI